MTTATKVSPANQARQFVAAVSAEGWRFSVNGSIVTIWKHFAAGDMNAFCDCDMTAYGLLSLAPLKGGSVWGTDGGSVGGMTAVNNGCYRLNKSGTAKRFIAELLKLQH
jgi:hypothetical protein